MLNRFLLIAVSVFVMAAYLPAQNLAFGLRAGTGIVKMNFTGPVPDHETAFGYSMGPSMLFQISPLYSLEADLLYSNKGTTYVQSVEMAKLTYRYTLGYISLPVLGKLYIPLESAIKPNAFIGMSFNYLVKSSLTFTSELQGNTTRSRQEDYYDKTYKFDMGVLIGAGTDYKLKSGILSFEVRYETGTSNIDNGIGNGPVKNNSLSIVMGYLHNF